MAGVDYCFHAAALKQVPSCEFYPMQAVKTNVVGTENVLKAARAAGEYEKKEQRCMYRIVRKEALKPTVILYEIEAPMVARKAERQT